MKIASVIVTYNRLEKLKRSVLRSLEESIDLCVIVDNNSSDGTYEWLSSVKDDRIIILRFDRNLGGAGGFHEGFKYVINNTDMDWIVCYDDDAYPSYGVIDAFRKFAGEIREDIASVASAVYLPNGEISEMNRPSYNPFWNIKVFINTIFKGRDGFHLGPESYKSGEIKFVDSSSFVGYFIKTDVVKKVGYPKKELFIYGDDIIYMLRVRKKGYKHIFNPNLIFYHNCETLVDQKPIYNPMWKAYYTFRNGIQIYKEAGGIIGLILVLPLKFISWYRMAKNYENSRKYKRLVYKATFDGLFNRLNLSHEDIVDMFK